MTYLCVATFVTDPGAARRDIAAAAQAGADMVELRIDRMNDAQAVQELVRSSPVPCIVTCRPTWEGGQCELPDEDRVGILLQASGSAYAVDLESATVRRMEGVLHRVKVRRIVSVHDFRGQPDRLYNLVDEMNRCEDADIVKIVWTARSIRDNLEAFEILKTRQKPTIALCMGEAGLISRVLARKFGGFLTYAAPDRSEGTAPGQIAVSDMKKLYRWQSIGRNTKVYGVVGSPIMHSMSPAIHNAAFEAIGYDGVYLPLLVQAGYESFKAFMETFVSFEGLDLSGLSVTIPHKENALRYLREKGAQIEPLAQSIGAVNTIIIDRGGGSARLRGMNTDYAAILDCITTKLGIAREDLAKYDVAVIGAGGTGRTAVAALAHYGASVVVHNRTQERAEALAGEFNGRRGKVVAAPLAELPDSRCGIFINATSVGMYPKVDQSPIGERPMRFSDQTLVFDTVYNPMKTRFRRQAEQAGAKTIGGVEMFVRQAVGQFEAWTARPAPAQIMCQVIEARLSR